MTSATIARVSGRPNFVIMIPDQLRADALGCFSNPVITTPHIDALAASGTVFGQAFVQHPVFSPSRASTSTGSSTRPHGPAVPTFPQRVGLGWSTWVSSMPDLQTTMMSRYELLRCAWRISLSLHGFSLSL